MQGTLQKLKFSFIHQSKKNPAVIAACIFGVVGTSLFFIPRIQHFLGFDNEAPHTIYHHKIKYASGQFLRPLSERDYEILFNDGRPREGAVRKTMFKPLAEGWEDKPMFEEKN